MIVRRSVPTSRKRVPCAVLVDGSSLYLAAQDHHDGRPLDYHGLVDLLVDKVPDLAKPDEPGALWTMWTSASAQNEGQSRFLEFVERDLRWEVRHFTPADSYMVEPTKLLGWSSDSRSAKRLIRFDASIAFAIACLAKKHVPLVVVSDSFALEEPMRRAMRLAPESAALYLAFFGRALDSRWQGVLRRESPVEFVDFDEHEDRLFGIQRTRPAERSEESEIVY